MKGLAYTSIPVDLVAGDQKAQAYVTMNPGQGVPTLELDDGTLLIQSMAILEWLDKTYPEPALLPESPLDQARVRSAALTIATDIHPVKNFCVIGALKSMGHSQEETVVWMNDWMKRGFTAFEQLIANDTPFCFGTSPRMADLCLVPQLYDAHRWGCDLQSFPRLIAIEDCCLNNKAFDLARPDNQPDAN